MIQDSGSNYSFYDHTEKAHPPRSVFDLSHLNSLTIPNAGLIVPIALLETMPDDDFDISVSSLIRVLPQVVTLYSRQRIFIHAYYSRLQELWNDAETFMTKGYNGDTNLVRPSISLTNFDTNVCGSTGSNTVAPDSLADYFGLPIGATYSDLFAAGVSALPFMMYERIYRDYYMNKNFYTENKQWLPNDDGDLRLNTNGDIISVLNSPTIPAGDTPIAFGALHYRDWTQDYFTSAVPWPQRGSAAGIPLSSGSIPVRVGNTSDSSVFLDAPGTSGGGFSLNFKVGSNRFWLYPSSLSVPSSASLTSSATLSSLQELNVDLSSVSPITVNQLRTALIEQSEMETMARTDGSYSEFGLAFFGVRSKASRSFKPTYIGGNYQSMVFTEVLQTSATTTSAGNASPLGSQAGHGISAKTGSIGHIYCDDFGYIMVVASIMPDTYYHQGLDRMWTRLTQNDMFLPDRAKLGMQAITNGELFFSGTLVNDRDVWAYQGRGDEYRYMQNKIHGKIADSTNASFYPYTQARTFSSLPGYSQDFARADDVRKDYLFSQVEDAYTAQFQINIRAVRPLPYKAVPASII